MKRLEDELAPADAVTAAAARLVRAAASSQVPPGLAQRVRSNVMAHERASTAFRPHPLLVAAVLVGLVALAGATAVRVWRDRRVVAEATHAPTVATKAPAVMFEHVAAAAPAPENPTPPPAPREIAIVPPATAAAPHPVAAHIATKPAVSPNVSADVPVDPVKPATTTDVASAALLVVDATRALHTDHDPAVARSLLDEYLRRYPHGDLAEEALALSIEAATLQDDPAAGVLARTYLKRFSSGRFREIATRAADRFAE